MNDGVLHGLLSEMEEIEDYFFRWGTDLEKAATAGSREQKDSLEKVAGINSHTALHRYIKGSASPNEINHLKSQGLIPRSGKSNKGKKEKSSKHMHKLSAASPSKAEMRRKKQRQRRLMDRLDKGLLGGFMVGGLGPTAYLKATGKIGVPNFFPYRGAAIGGGLAGLYHLLKEREKEKVALDKVAVGGDAGFTMKDMKAGTHRIYNPKGHMRVPVRKWVVGGYDSKGRPKMGYTTVQEDRGGLGGSTDSEKWTETPSAKPTNEKEDSASA